MPDRTAQREIDKFDALLRLLEEDGASPAGNPPPAKYITALREIEDLDRERIRGVADAHKEGTDPPTGGSN